MRNIRNIQWTANNIIPITNNIINRLAPFVSDWRFFWVIDLKIKIPIIRPYQLQLGFGSLWHSNSKSGLLTKLSSSGTRHIVKRFILSNRCFELRNHFTIVFLQPYRNNITLSNEPRQSHHLGPSLRIWWVKNAYVIRTILIIDQCFIRISGWTAISVSDDFTILCLSDRKLLITEVHDRLTHHDRLITKITSKIWRPVIGKDSKVRSDRDFTGNFSIHVR